MRKIHILISILLITSCLMARQKIGFVGAAADLTQLTDEERAAYDWLKLHYNTVFIPINSIEQDASILNTVEVLWWHHDMSNTTPSAAQKSVVVEAFKDFLRQGKGLLLTGFAPQYVVDLGVEDTAPQEVHRGLTTSGNWGFYALDTEHPIFNGLSRPFYTLSAGLQVWNSICWWNNSSFFDGKWLADVEWQSGTLVTAGEYQLGSGKIIVVGAGAYDWYIENGTNSYRSNLEKFTQNILTYLTPPEKIKLVFLGNSEQVTSLSLEEQAAYHFADSIAQCQYLSFTQLMNDTSQLNGHQVVWWHFDESLTLPTVALNTKVIEAFNRYLEKGYGLLLTGLAAQYVVDLGIETNEPDVLEKDSTTSGISGFYRKVASHPIFEGLLNPLLTINSGMEIELQNCYWQPADHFNGIWLADAEFPKDMVAICEYRVVTGKVIVAGYSAFEWAKLNYNTYRQNLFQLTENMITYLAEKTIFLPDGKMAEWDFDEKSGRVAHENVSESNFKIESNFPQTEWKVGVFDQALRLDGYSTVVSGQLPESFYSRAALSVSSWLAIEANPVREAAVINQQTSTKGFILGIGKLGNPFFAIATIDGTWRRVESSEVVPKNKWFLLTATFSENGQLKLYMNDELIAQTSFSPQQWAPATEVPIEIARNSKSEYSGIFPMGVINGLIDQSRMYNRALTDEEIQQYYQSTSNNLLAPDFTIPQSRFAQDFHRPKYHALPPANWTNEAHGLIYYNNRYHLFYQKNPNGPYWEQIHWGHLSSVDLLHWKEEPIALAPQAGIDQRGIWSGCTVNDNGQLKAMYTAVDGFKARMALAIADEQAKHFQKLGAVLQAPPESYDHLDFRDPFIWKDKGFWYMIIGSGIRNQGGTVFLYRSNNLIDWNFLHPLKIGNIAQSGEFWEMPIFFKLKDRWILLVNKTPTPNNPAKALYWTGAWQDEQFIVDHEAPKALELINHLLSPTIVYDQQGRLVAIGIIPDQRSQELNYKAGWAHLYSLPRVWTLSNSGEIIQQPLPELELLRSEVISKSNLTIESGVQGYLGETLYDQHEIIVEWHNVNATRFGVSLYQAADRSEFTSLYLDVSTSELVIDLSNSSLLDGVDKGIYRATLPDTVQNDLKLRIFVDHSVLEVFVNGHWSFAKRIFPSNSESFRADLFCEGGTAKINNLKIFKIASTPMALEQTRTKIKLNPQNFELTNPFPNPFNSATNIQLKLEKTCMVKFNIYTITGQQIYSLHLPNPMAQGKYRLRWQGIDDHGRSLASGIYIAQIRIDQQNVTKKLILLR